MLSQRCQYSVAAERAREIGPTSDVERVKYLLAVTSESVNLAEPESVVYRGRRSRRSRHRRARSTGHAFAAHGSPRGSRHDSVLRGRSERTFFQNNWGDPYPLLAEFVEAVASLPGLEADLARTVGSRGEVLDSASAQLGDIRRDVRVAHRRLLDRLNRMIADAGPNSAIQDPIVTMREGRYVIPVRADRRAQVPGVVHGTSASGQTLFVEPMDVVAAQQSVARTPDGGGA